jgi:excisionase family DNA binding protein
MELQAIAAPTLISIRQAAELASVSRTHVWRLVQSGQVEAVRVGDDGPIRIRCEQFLEWLYGESRGAA